MMRPCRPMRTSSPAAGSKDACGGVSGGTAADEILQPRTGVNDLVGRATEPLRQRLVDEEEAAGTIDGIEADRRIVEEVDDDRLLAPRGDGFRPHWLCAAE
jgi:hypothetical protein